MSFRKEIVLEKDELGRNILTPEFIK